MRTTINIDDELLAAAKLIAVRSNRTLGSVVEEALREMPARHRAAKKGARVSLPVSGAGGLVPGVDLANKDQLAELLGDESLP